MGLVPVFGLQWLVELECCVLENCLALSAPYSAEILLIFLSPPFSLLFFVAKVQGTAPEYHLELHKQEMEMSKLLLLR